jgi:hypothetical protein
MSSVNFVELLLNQKITQILDLVTIYGTVF